MTRIAIQEEYKVVWEVLSSLMEQDSELADSVKRIGTQSGYGGWHEKYDTSAHLKILAANDSLEDLINVRILKNITSQWDVMFGQLLLFKEQFGHTKISDKNKTHKNLGAWVRAQRRLYKNGTINEDHKNRLLEMGFVFVPPNYRSDEEWEKRLKIYTQYVKGKIKLEGELKEIFSWAASQRKLFKEGKLTAYREGKLRKANFEFDPLYTRPQLDSLQDMLIFIKQHGHSKVPFIKKRAGRQVANHAQSKIRQLYLWRQKVVSQYKKGKLNPSVAQALNEANFQWEA